MNHIKHNINIEPVFNHANDNGKKYLLSLVQRRSIKAVFYTSENWFFVFTDEDHVYYISQKSDCQSGYFGNTDHFIKTIKNEIYEKAI